MVATKRKTGQTNVSFRSLAMLMVCSIIASSAWAGFQAGEDAYNGKDYATALRELRPLAERGHAAAQNYLGEMYNYGRAVQKDDVEAVKWFQKAAERGHAAAQTNLAWMYVNGWGVRKDYVEAVEWFQKAAEQGR